MTYVSKRLVNLLARALDSNDREAVLGDLDESGAGNGWTVVEIGGLLVRRQATGYGGRYGVIRIVGAAAVAVFGGWLSFGGHVIPTSLVD